MDRQEVYNLFIYELMHCEEYAIVLKMKELIINSIKTPLIQERVIYNFQSPITLEQIGNIKLCQKLLFGFYSDEITNDYCVIDMKNFLF